MIFRCPNYSKCLLGYHGDDINISADEPPVCPECGSPLEVKTTPRTALVPNLISWLTLALFAIAIWLAWPTATRWWKKITAPPAQER